MCPPVKQRRDSNHSFCMGNRYINKFWIVQSAVLVQHGVYYSTYITCRFYICIHIWYIYIYYVNIYIYIHISWYKCIDTFASHSPKKVDLLNHILLCNYRCSCSISKNPRYKLPQQSYPPKNTTSCKKRPYDSPRIPHWFDQFCPGNCGWFMGQKRLRSSICTDRLL